VEIKISKKRKEKSHDPPILSHCGRIEMDTCYYLVDIFLTFFHAYLHTEYLFFQNMEFTPKP
jgi:hypothetical protein